MENFGFSLKQSRTVNLAQADMRKFDQLLDAVPSYKRCIGCGGCTASCSARQFTDFDIDEALAMQKHISDYEFNITFHLDR